MPCHINNCQITDASHLMQCSGSCGRSYHAACAGTQRNYENEITNYMIPLCRDCQGVISVEVTTRAVLLQQQKLTCDIKALIDANFKACNAFKQMDNKIEVVQDEYEGIATLLGDMQQQLNRRMQKSFCSVFFCLGVTLVLLSMKSSRRLRQSQPISRLVLSKPRLITKLSLMS